MSISLSPWKTFLHSMLTDNISLYFQGHLPCLFCLFFVGLTLVLLGLCRLAFLLGILVKECLILHVVAVVCVSFVVLVGLLFAGCGGCLFFGRLVRFFKLLLLFCTLFRVALFFLCFFRWNIGFEAEMMCWSILKMLRRNSNLLGFLQPRFKTLRRITFLVKNLLLPLIQLFVFAFLLNRLKLLFEYFLVSLR